MHATATKKADQAALMTFKANFNLKLASTEQEQ